jgi:hypothetical protein
LRIFTNVGLERVFVNHPIFACNTHLSTRYVCVTSRPPQQAGFSSLPTSKMCVELKVSVKRSTQRIITRRIRGWVGRMREEKRGYGAVQTERRSGSSPNYCTLRAHPISDAS